MNDIYAYFDYHGTLKERVSAPIRANSTQVNSIYAYWDNQSVEPVTYSVTWRLVGSDSFETTSEHYAETLAIPANYLRRRDLVFFKEAKLYNFIRFPVPSAVTAVAGTYIATIRYALSTQATFVLGSLTFDVEGDRGIVLGESLTLDQYNYLLEQYSEVYDWATLRFLPLTGGTLTGDLTIDGHDLAAERVFAKELWQQTNDALIMHYDGDSNEIRFGTPSGDFNPTFFGSLGVYMWDGRTKEYPTIRFDYYDGDGDYDETIEERVASQEWADAQYLKLTGGAVTGPVSFGSSVTANGYVQLNNGLTVSGSEIHGGTEYHAGNISLGNSGSDNSKTLNVYYTTNLRGPVTSSTILPGNVGFSIGGSGSGQRWNTIYSQYLDVTQSIKNSGNTYTFPSGSGVLATTDYVDTLVASVKANAFQVVQTLPQSGEEGIIYLVPVSGEDYYTQYIWEGNNWLDIGDTDIDLSGYLPLSGGSITGDLTINGSVSLNGSDLETELSEKADKTGYYGTMGAGYADTAKSLQTSVGRADETPFGFQTTGGSADVETGIQQLRKLVGASVVDNQQIIDNGNHPHHQSWTIDNSAGESALYGTQFFECASGYRLTIGHKYLIWFVGSKTITGEGNAKLYINVANSQSNVFDFRIGYAVVEISTINYPNSDVKINTQIAAGVSLTINGDLLFTDLTQRYGNNTLVNAIIGNDSSTQVKKLLQFDPSILKQTAYDAGTLSSSQSAKLKNVGYNAMSLNRTQGDTTGWRVENTSQRTLEADKYYVGLTANNYFNASNASLISISENSVVIKTNAGGYGVGFPIRVIGGETYTLEFTASDGTTAKRVGWFDRYGYLISFDMNNPTKVAPANAYWALVVLCPTTISANVTFTNVCIHLTWDSSKTGYEPYESQTYDLPNIVQRGILKVDGDGNVYADGDVAYPDGTGETRYGIYTFTGNETVIAGGTSASGVYRWRINVLSSLIKPITTTTDSAAIVCSKYYLSIPTGSDGTYGGHEGISVDSNGTILLFDNTFSGGTSADATGLLAKLNGVSIIYELATPTPITSDPFPENVWADDFGTMQFLDSDGNEIIGLQGADFFYQANIAGFAESVYVKTDGDPEKIVYEDEVYAKAQADARFALKEALGGTLRQVLAVKASIGFDNTNYIDMGTADWTIFSSSTYGYTVFRVAVSDLKTEANDSAMRNVLSTKYATSSWSDIYANGKDKVVSTIGTHIVVCDTSYTDVDSFKAAMAGVLLAYEKAS